MKPIVLSVIFLFFCFSTRNVYAQDSSKAKNIIIITIDGFRWQELFSGADKNIISNTNFVKDTSLTKQLFWDTTADLRRKKMMPFLWSVIAAKGQIYGNRFLNNKSDVTKWYKISYPGYNEMLTGYADPFFIPNIPINNRNKTVLEYLNTTENYIGKTVAFTSWNIFPYIFNEKRSKLPLNINDVETNVINKKNTHYDMLTFLNAKDYINNHHPKVVFLGFGQTDEFAHEGRYDLYLQQASAIDRMIAELWYMLQTDPFYKDNTTLIITTDHGRGASPSSWFTHGLFTKGSSNTWFAVMGPEIIPAGEIKVNEQIYQKQNAPTLALLVGEKFNPIKTSSDKSCQPLSLNPRYTNTNFLSSK